MFLGDPLIPFGLGSHQNNIFASFSGLSCPGLSPLIRHLFPRPGPLIQQSYFSAIKVIISKSVSELFAKA